MQAALVDGVEERVAPVTIEGTKSMDDSAALGLALRRRHCGLAGSMFHFV